MYSTVHFDVASGVRIDMEGKVAVVAGGGYGMG